MLLKTPISPAPAWFDLTAARHLAEAGAPLEPPVSGTVYGTVLNVRSQVEQMAEAMTRPPYQAPAQAPVLYIKPPNTFRPHGGVVPVPVEAEELEVNATLAVVMGRSIGRATEAQVMEAVLGYTVAIDVCIPHASLYRPAIRQRCRDGFLPIGPWIVERAAVADPDALEVTVAVNGQRRSRFSTAELVRPTARLLAEISAFSTLHAGDVVLVGLPPDGPRARAGDTVVAEIPTVGRLQCVLQAEGAA
ncbi:MAG TPA: fumarylacetoacetate hydrolase family protein [Caulobacteraceae bacterium]|nr:fumarylacetoacetate hydrolase family protein [Caulobacteraceae bacterium]